MEYIQSTDKLSVLVRLQKPRSIPMTRTLLCRSSRLREALGKNTNGVTATQSRKKMGLPIKCGRK